MTDLTLLVLAAGKGTRMRNDRAKVMHSLAGRSLIGHVVALGAECAASDVVVVLGPGMQDVEAEVLRHRPDAKIAIQKEALGTGHAVKSALDHLPSLGGVAVVFGDTPLLTGETVLELEAQRRRNDSAVVVMGMRPPRSEGYGRLKLGKDDRLVAIVEHVVADDDLRRTAACNSGIMLIDARKCRELVEALPKQPHNGEYYLTDIVQIAVSRGWRCDSEVVDFEEGHGVNTQAQLAQAEAILQGRLRAYALESGAVMPSPETVHFAFDTSIGPGAVIEPFVVFGPGTRVSGNATIRSFSHLEGAHIGEGATVGPYARIRPGSDIGRNARIGNFVETKNAHVADGAKANHLTYLGDCSVGVGSNIGAGTITCNYDGYNKSRTEIGDDVFVGSNTALVAPVRIGDGSIIGAGSTITSDLPDGAVGLTRAAQSVRKGAAAPLRRRLAQKKSRASG